MCIKPRVINDREMTVNH